MTSSDIAPERWDIVVLPFPYTEQLAEKRRPALVITPTAFNRAHKLVWIAMITSASNAGWSGDVEITGLERAGLPAPSVVRCAKIATIDPARILRKAGEADAATREKVHGVLLSILA